MGQIYPHMGRIRLPWQLITGRIHIRVEAVERRGTKLYQRRLIGQLRLSRQITGTSTSGYLTMVVLLLLDNSVPLPTSAAHGGREDMDSDGPADLSATSDVAWRRLQDAKLLLDSTRAYLHEVKHDMKAGLVPAPDGEYAHSRALRLHCEAIENYLQALNDCIAAASQAHANGAGESSPMPQRVQRG